MQLMLKHLSSRAKLLKLFKDTIKKFLPTQPMYFFLNHISKPIT